ncbi:hypothetical protein AB0M20_30890, partial [Actinoplanes sp. NPDC051633]|uniref:nSTAND1 domain-containing NTPase n=1 Tax=Actinoplanes sp. NPDC051633 TaxID=3155670 RepID=UPI0034272A22
MIDHSQSVQSARDGVRSWVRSAGAGLRRATPYGIVAFLGASAVAPVVGAALGATAEMNAALGQLGGMGSNYLSNALVSAADRARGDAGPEGLRDEIAAELLARLDSGDAGLRDEIASVLRAVGAVDIALREADDDLRLELAGAFGALGADVGRLHLLAEDASRSLAALGIEQRQQTDLIRQSLIATHQIREELRGRRPLATPRPVSPEGPGDDPGGPAPYPGMASFDSLDARYFRGRETLVAELLGRLSEQLIGGPPLVVVGVSGAGKSSLLRAGLLPALDGLTEDSGSWPWLVMTPGATPLAELTGRLEALADASRVVIVVDQFEELFTQCTDPAERLAFAAALAAAAPALVIIAVRADFYPQCTELPPMVDMLAGQVVVGPLSTAELRRAIREPAAIAGYTLEPGLEDLLLADLGALGGGGSLPLLAHALRATWDRRDGDTMTVAGYRATGGIRRAVAETAETIYLGLDEDGRAALRRAMLALVTIVDDLPVRHRASHAEADVGVLAPMIAARLVTAGEETVEVSHEALLTGWGRLAGWLVEERQTILLRQRLALAAADWVASGEDRDSLYRGARLDAAREWAAGRHLPEAQRRFLAAAESAAQDRELVRRRTTNRLRRTVAGLAVALLLAVTGGAVAWYQRGQAEDNWQVARSRQLAAEMRTDFFFDELSADRNALDSWAASRTTEARSALFSAQQTTTIGPLGAEQGAYRVAVGPVGRRVAVGYRDGRVQLWDAATLRLERELRHPGASLIDLAFSPDGRYLASGSISRTDGVALWDVATGTLIRTLPAFAAAAWLPDSSAVVAMRADKAGPDGAILGVWRPADGKLLDSIPTHSGVALALAVSAAGDHVAVAGLGRVEVIRRFDGRVTMTDAGRDYADVVFTRDGRLVTLTLASAELVSWNPMSGRRIARLSEADHPLSPNRIAVTPDGTVLAQSQRPNSIQRLLADGGGARLEFSLFRGMAQSIAVSGDGKTLVVAGLDSPPMLFRLGVGRLWHPSSVGYVAFGPGGDVVASQAFEPRVRLWNARAGDLTGTIELTGGADEPRGMAIGPDRTLVASAGDGRVLVFGPDGRLRLTLRSADGKVARSPAISPDGSLLAVAFLDEDDATALPGVGVWDLRSGTALGELDTADQSAEHVAFTPDG